MIVYLIYCTASDKYYVGWTQKKLEARWRVHCADAAADRYPHKHFHRAIRTYGPAAFELYQLCEVETKQQAMTFERLWVWALRSYSPLGWAIT